MPGNIDLPACPHARAPIYTGTRAHDSPGAGGRFHGGPCSALEAAGITECLETLKCPSRRARGHDGGHGQPAGVTRRHAAPAGPRPRRSEEISPGAAIGIAVPGEFLGAVREHATQHRWPVGSEAPAR